MIKRFFIFLLLYGPTFAEHCLAMDENWAAEALAIATKSNLITIDLESNDGRNPIKVIQTRSGKTVAVFKEGKERALKEDFLCCFSKMIGLNGVVAEAEYVPHFTCSGNEVPREGLLEQFIRVDDQVPLDRASPELKNLICEAMDNRGSLTIHRFVKFFGFKRASVELFYQYISRRSAENLFIFSMITGAIDAVARNTLLRLNQEGLLDLVLTDTNFCLCQATPADSIVISLPHGNYPLSESGLALVKSLDPERLESLFGDKISTFFSKGAVRMFVERVRHFRQMALHRPDLSLRNLQLLSFPFCVLKTETPLTIDLEYYTESIRTLRYADIALCSADYEGAKRNGNEKEINAALDRNLYSFYYFLRHYDARLSQHCTKGTYDVKDLIGLYDFFHPSFIFALLNRTNETYEELTKIFEQYLSIRMATFRVNDTEYVVNPEIQGVEASVRVDLEKEIISVAGVCGDHSTVPLREIAVLFKGKVLSTFPVHPSLAFGGEIDIKGMEFRNFVKDEIKVLGFDDKAGFKVLGDVKVTENKGIRYLHKHLFFYEH